MSDLTRYYLRRPLEALDPTRGVDLLRLHGFSLGSANDRPAELGEIYWDRKGLECDGWPLRVAGTVGANLKVDALNCTSQQLCCNYSVAMSAQRGVSYIAGGV